MNKPAISFIVLVISVIFIFFYVRPAYSAVQARRNDLVSLQNILNNSGKIQILIDQTTQNLNSIDATGLARFAVFLPEKIDVIRFANNLQHIGLANGIILEKIKTEGASADKQDSTEAGTATQQGYASALFADNKVQQTASSRVATVGTAVEKRFVTTKASFTFVSTYEKFQLFLNDLEKSLGLVNITALTFNPLPEVVDPKKPKSVVVPLYQFTVDLETYSLL